MKWVVYYSEKGNVVSANSFDLAAEITSSPFEGAPYILVYEGPLDPMECFVEKNTLTPLPERPPNLFCTWDKFKKEWVDSRDLTEVVHFYLHEIDACAEAARAKLITAAPGQAMTYEVKHQEALAGGGPMLQAEADALGMTLQEVVDSVLSARNKWLDLAKQIETARLRAKQAIRASTTAAEMHETVVELNAILNA